jgi:cell division septum initiation protein DivIVA
VTAHRSSNVFSIREQGYDVGEVTAHIAALEERVARLESGPSGEKAAEALVIEARREAMRLLVSARDDAEMMIEEARREAESIIAAAQTEVNGTVAVPTLEPELEIIKTVLPIPSQLAFVAVAQRRSG